MLHAESRRVCCEKKRKRIFLLNNNSRDFFRSPFHLVWLKCEGVSNEWYGFESIEKKQFRRIILIVDCTMAHYSVAMEVSKNGSLIMSLPNVVNASRYYNSCRLCCVYLRPAFG